MWPPCLIAAVHASFPIYTWFERISGRRNAMFERYTKAARLTLFLARYIANQTGSSCIESEHLLVGVLVVDNGLALRFFGSPSAAEDVWKKIESSKPMREPVLNPTDLPLANECKRA